MASSVSSGPEGLQSLLDGLSYRFDDLPEVQWKPNGADKYQVSALHIPKDRSVVRVKHDNGTLGVAVRIRQKCTSAAEKVARLAGTIVLYHLNSTYRWRMSDSLENRLLQLYQKEHEPRCTKERGYMECPTCPAIPSSQGKGATASEGDWLKGILNGSDPLVELDDSIIPAQSAASAPSASASANEVPTGADSAERDQSAPTGLRWVAAQIGHFFSAIWGLLAYLGNTLRSCCSRPANA